MVALFQNGVTFVGNSGLIPGVPFQPAKPGDSITAYGIGFGAVTPAIAPGVVVGGQNSIPNLTISFGATPATLTYAGLAPGNIGLYQFNITVPQVANGDYQINVIVDGVQGEVSGSVRDAGQPALLSSFRCQGASDSEPQDHTTDP
jgi:uncharacterized protein (TIGR03437 family)